MTHTGTAQLWTYGDTVLPQGAALENFNVNALDGHIGKIDAATYETGLSYIVVDTGFWIFGTRRLIPASAIEMIDLEREVVELRLTKEQVKNAPEYDEHRHREDMEYRESLSDYYAQFPPLV